MHMSVVAQGFDSYVTASSVVNLHVQSASSWTHKCHFVNFKKPTSIGCHCSSILVLPYIGLWTVMPMQLVHGWVYLLPFAYGCGIVHGSKQPHMDQPNLDRTSILWLVVASKKREKTAALHVLRKPLEQLQQKMVNNWEADISDKKPKSPCNSLSTTSALRNSTP